MANNLVLNNLEKKGLTMPSPYQQDIKLFKNNEDIKHGKVNQRGFTIIKKLTMKQITKIK